VSQTNPREYVNQAMDSAALADPGFKGFDEKMAEIQNSSNNECPTIQLSSQPRISQILAVVSLLQ